MANDSFYNHFTEAEKNIFSIKTLIVYQACVLGLFTLSSLKV